MKKNSMNSRHSNGFTLIEVMVALAIIALSLTGMAVTMGGMLNNATVMRERTYASWIAQNKIVELRLANVVPETNVTSGEIEYANTFWDWRAEVSETGVENLFRVDVEVFRPGTDDLIRVVSGFVGEPIVPGQSNEAWSQLSSGSDERNQGVTE
jgi:general secretion pathway protein I